MNAKYWTEIKVFKHWKLRNTRRASSTNDCNLKRNTHHTFFRAHGVLFALRIQVHADNISRKLQNWNMKWHSFHWSDFWADRLYFFNKILGPKILAIQKRQKNRKFSSRGFMYTSYKMRSSWWSPPSTGIVPKLEAASMQVRKPWMHHDMNWSPSECRTIWVYFHRE